LVVGIFFLGRRVTIEALQIRIFALFKKFRKWSSGFRPKAGYMVLLEVSDEFQS
jgi:hypothetical protein